MGEDVMANNKSAAVFVLLLAFLFLLTAPLVLIFGHSAGLLQLPQVNYRSIAAAAAAGLFIIPVLMVFLAVIIAAVKRRGLAVPSAAVDNLAAKRAQIGSSRNSANGGMRNRAWHDLRLRSPAEAGLAPVRYAWEGMFGAEEREHKEKRKPASKPSAAGFSFSQRAVAAVVVAVVVLALLAALQQKGAFISGADKALEEKPAVVEVKPQHNFTSVKLSAVAKKAVDSARGFAGKIKGKFASSVSKAKLAVAKVPSAAWQNIAIAVIVVLFAGTVFYSHKAGQLGGILKWLREWLGWLAAIFAYAMKNKLKVLLLVIAAAVASAVIAAVIFRKWLIAKFPAVSASGMADAAANALLAVKDFVSVYRIYIIIGVFALLAIVGLLVALEKKDKG